MMHDGGFGSGWFHFLPGLGHGPLGLLVWLLIIAALVVLIRSLFRKKE